MKTFSAVLISLVFAVAACGKGKKEEAKTEGEAKTTEPAKDPAAGTPTPTPSPDKAPEPPKAEPAAGGAGGSTMSVDEAGTKATAFFDKVTKAIEDGGADCAKMGANLKGLEGEAKTLSVESKAFDADAAKKKEFDEKYGKKLEEKMGAFAPKLEKCISNAEVSGFFKNLAGE